MAAAPDPDEVFCSSKGRDNFQRLAGLLISGGTVLLREVFDVKCPPSNLPATLQNPATEKLLKAAKLTKPQWDCLYPSAGTYGKSTDFDITLTPFPVAEDNMRPHPSCHGLGLFSFKYRPQLWS